MSRRGRLYDLAAIGCLIAAFLCSDDSQQRQSQLPQGEDVARQQAQSQAPVVSDGTTLRAIFDEWKKLDADKDAADAAKEKRQTFWERTTKDPVAFYTLLLVVVTGTLAGVTGYLVFYTSRLWSATVRLGRDSERSLKAAEQSALAAMKQIRISHEDFIAVHRPRIEVRSASITSFDEVPLVVSFTVSNDGETGADIEESNVTLEFLSLPPPPPLYEGFDVVPHIRFEPGDKERPSCSYAGYDVTRKNVLDDSRCLHLFGFIRYRDANKTARTLGFCFRWDRDSRRFMRNYDEPDYAYGDQ